MSAVEILPPVSPVVVTRDVRADHDPGGGAHLWHTDDPLLRPLCGAEQNYHPCPMSVVDSTTDRCPHCGEPICTYCRLLAEARGWR